MTGRGVRVAPIMGVLKSPGFRHWPAVETRSRTSHRTIVAQLFSDPIVKLAHEDLLPYEHP